jgi:hypothetical protein
MVNTNSATNSYILLVFVIVVSFFYYLGGALNFIVPYGSDEVIQVWPIGYALSESSFQNFPQVLTASFLGEDHLFPVGNFLSYLIYSSKLDPIATIGIVAKIIYIAILAVTGLLVNFLYADRLKTILVLGLIISNQALVFINQTHNIVNNLSVFFSIFGFYIVVKYILTRKNKYLIFIWFLFLLGSFSFESFFITYAVAVFFSLYQIYLSDEIKKDKIWIIVRLFSTLFLSLIPYLAIHYQLYGSILPATRVDAAGESQQLITAALAGVQVLNDWLYGLPKHLFLNPYHAFVAFPVLGLILFIVRNKVDLFKNRNTNALLFSSILSVFVIMYTGRYHPGMWSFSGILFIVAFSDIIKNTVENFRINLRGEHFVFIFFIVFIAVINYVTKPYNNLVHFYKEINRTSNAAYNVLGSSVNKIVVVRLPNAPDLVHPIAFWIGNQIYHQSPGLSYFPDHNILRMKNMYIERYSNANNNKSFSFFESLLEDYRGESKVLFKDLNLYFTFPDKDSNGVVYHGSVFSKPIDGAYKVYIPKYFRNLSSDVQLNVDVILDNPALQSYQLMYGGKLQSNSTISGNKLSFVTDDFSSPNEITIINKNSGKSVLLKDIKISSPSKLKISTPNHTKKNNDSLLITTQSGPCSFWLDASMPLDINIDATLDKMASLSINTLYPIYKIKTHLIEGHVSFETNKNIDSSFDIKSTSYICR